MRQTSEYSGKQAGDPVRGGEAMIRVTQVEEPPRHLVLGEIGYNNVTNKLRERLAQIEEWRETSLGADFPKA